VPLISANYTNVNIINMHICGVFISIIWCKKVTVPFITPRRVSIRKSEKIIDIEKKNGIKSNNEKPTKRMKN